MKYDLFESDYTEELRLHSLLYLIFSKKYMDGFVQHLELGLVLERTV
jgi:hypothetical protein